MSFSVVGNGSFSAGSVQQRVLNAPFKRKPWVRNPSWPVLTTPTGQTFKALFAVWPGTANFFAAQVTVSSGTYTTDYGDGSSTVATTSGVQLNYNYNYSAAGLANTNAPVTLQDSGDLVLRTAHGYSDGMTVQFWGIVSTTGLTEGQTYFVINATTDDFQVSLTSGGSAVTLTTNGTAALLPYKIATVTITPTTGGATFSNITLPKHNQTNLVAGYANGFLEIKVAHTVCTTFRLSDSTGTATNSRNLENLEILGGTWTPSSTVLNQTCTSLARVRIEFNNSSNFTLNSLFSGCRALEQVEIILLNTGKPNNCTNLFSGNFSLEQVPLFDTSAVQDMGGMFASCVSLKSVPLFNTAAVTNMAQMFLGCTSLDAVPLFNTSSVTSFNGMFSGCSLLSSVPLFNTQSALGTSSMFQNCYSLTTVPLLNTASVTNMSSMFSGCASLLAVPSFNTGAATNMSSMFTGCISLETVPLFNTASVTNMANMFSSCSSLVSVPLFNTASVTNMASMFSACTSLSSVPLFNTAAATNMSSCFANCALLPTMPPFNTAAVTNATSMMTGCASLLEVPAFNLAAVSSSANMATWVGGTTNVIRIRATGVRFTHAISNQRLSGAALDEYYTGLPTITSQTITVSFNFGTTSDTPTIATAKGWTVTGS